MKRRLTTPLKNQKGLLILDFIFSAVLFSVFVMIMFSFSITFTVVEVFQYVSYSSARAYTLAHQSEDVQEQRGRAKFEQLAGDDRLLSMIRSGWFTIGDAQVGDFNEELANDNDRGLDAGIFNGVRIPFTAPILYKRMALLGNTGSSPDAFFAWIQSFTGREPTLEECQNFTAERINGVSGFYGATQQTYFVQYDNGC